MKRAEAIKRRERKKGEGKEIRQNVNNARLHL